MNLLRQMKTIKLPIEYSNKDDLNIISEYIRLQNSVIRISYNRFKEKYSEKDIRNYLKSMNLSSDLISIDSWFIQSAIYKAKEMFNKDVSSFKANGTFPKRIFGSKSNLIKSFLLNPTSTVPTTSSSFEMIGT